jgi:hypothetical protein
MQPVESGDEVLRRLNTLLPTMVIRVIPPYVQGISILLRWRLLDRIVLLDTGSPHFLADNIEDLHGFEVDRVMFPAIIGGHVVLKGVGGKPDAVAIDTRPPL